MNNPFVEQLIEALLSGSGPLYLVLALVVLGALAARRASRDPAVQRRALLVAGLVLIFALLQIFLGQIPEQMARPDNLTYVVLSVSVLILGYLSALLIGTFVFVDFLLVRLLKFEIPNILRDASVFALFFVGVLLILYRRTDLDVTGLFTTAGVLSIVIGLALQDTLGNVFSGLAIQTERSFNVGDWVRFGDLEGVVVDVSWRATKLRTRQNDLVIIPNTQISKDVLINYSAPTRVHAIQQEIGVHYRHPPAGVIAAIEEAADQTDGILKRPRVDVRTFHYGDFAITYQVKYWIKDYADLEDIRNAFMTRIWYAFRRNDIEIPFPIRNVFLQQVTQESLQAESERREERIFRYLRRVEVFGALSEQEARELAGRTRVEQYFRGETVIRQGTAGDSLYIIDDGLVEVIVSHNGRSESLAQLGPRSFFGEMALLTGEERTATVVTLAPTDFIVVDREAFRETLERNPPIAEKI
ncbi:MAG TPA: cyclic nucleotide-binding domain-containing protein, partial [Gemmatimonadota bacterium]|nr:cyclic nucleotide-binding domain-containing protein [Gemmatimonadota bacterium]